MTDKKDFDISVYVFEPPLGGILMANPIKATPRLSGKASYDFQKELVEKENKKLKFSFVELSLATKKKIVDEGPNW